MKKIYDYIGNATDGMSGLDWVRLANKIEHEFSNIVKDEWIQKFGKEPVSGDEFADKFSKLDLSEISMKNGEYLKPILGEYYKGDKKDYYALDKYLVERLGTAYLVFPPLLKFTYDLDAKAIYRTVFASNANS